jgi:hypothetical protein
MESRKITVKHYLNKRAKPRLLRKEKYYPLYIQIIVSGKKAQIKSKINEHLKIYRSDIERLTNQEEELNDLFLEGFFTESFLKTILKSRMFPLYHLLNDEVQVITRIIKFHKPFESNNFTLSNFSDQYRIHTTEITHILDSRIKERYSKELKSIFLKTIDEEENRETFRISNYFIHFINWSNTFNNFYEGTFEVMPSELKSIENLLSNDLRITIKAFMAYHTKVNILKRFFEKREKGKISTLSYLDWETDIKAFLHKEFEDLFGEQKSLEYIISLDNILREEVSAVEG